LCGFRLSTSARLGVARLCVLPVTFSSITISPRLIWSRCLAAHWREVCGGAVEAFFCARCLLGMPCLAQCELVVFRTSMVMRGKAMGEGACRAVIVWVRSYRSYSTKSEGQGWMKMSRQLIRGASWGRVTHTRHRGNCTRNYPGLPVQCGSNARAFGEGGAIGFPVISHDEMAWGFFRRPQNGV